MNSLASDHVSGMFDVVLLTTDFRELVIGQFASYAAAKQLARRIMQEERDFHPYALRVIVKPSRRRHYFPPERRAGENKE